MTGLIDLGATKSCINSFPFILNNVTIKSVPYILKTADNNIINCSGTISTNIQIENDTFPIDLIIIDNLSTDLILGMDLIYHFHFQTGSEFVNLNFKIYKRFDFRYLRLSNNVYPNKFGPTRLKVLNPYYCLYNGNLLIEGLEGRGFIIEETLVKSDQYLSIFICTSELKDALYKSDVLAKVSPYTDPVLNHIIECNSSEENELLRVFQENRKNKFIKNGVVPKIGRIGNISDDQKTQILTILEQNSLAFSWSDDDLGTAHFFRYTIPLSNESQSAYEPPRPVPPALKTKVADQIAQWVRLGLVEPGSSNHNIPLVIVKKPDGRKRTSLDARKLNSLSKFDRWPCPNILEIINEVGMSIKSGNSTFISVFDLTRAYWQILVHDDDKSKVSFSFNSCQYISNRVLYGLCSAPAGFCKIMYKIFHNINLTI